MDARNEPGHGFGRESGTPFVTWCEPDQHGSTGLAKRAPGSARARPFSCSSPSIVPDSAPGRFQKNQSRLDLRCPWANPRPMAGIAFTDDQPAPGTYLGLLLNLRRGHRVLPAACYRAAFQERTPRCGTVRNDDGYPPPPRLFSIRDFELCFAGRGMPSQPGLLERQRLSRARTVGVLHRFRMPMAEY